MLFLAAHCPSEIIGDPPAFSHDLIDEERTAQLNLTEYALKVIG